MGGGGNGMVQITDMQAVGRKKAAGRMRREWKLERKVGENITSGAAF